MLTMETFAAVLAATVLAAIAIGLLLDVMARPDRWRPIFEETRWGLVTAWILVLALAAIAGLLLGGSSGTPVAVVSVTALVMLSVVVRIWLTWDRDDRPRR